MGWGGRHHLSVVKDRKTRQGYTMHSASDEKRASKGIAVCFVCRDDSEVSSAHLEALMDAFPSSDRLPCGPFLNGAPDRETGELVGGGGGGEKERANQRKSGRDRDRERQRQTDRDRHGGCEQTERLTIRT